MALSIRCKSPLSGSAVARLAAATAPGAVPGFLNQRSTLRRRIAKRQYMPAVRLAHVKEVRDDGSMVEIVIWKLPQPIPPSTHMYKYRLYYGRGGTCRVLYDNERGKGDHRHVGGEERGYVFRSVEQLLEDFRADVERWEVA